MQDVFEFYTGKRERERERERERAVDGIHKMDISLKLLPNSYQRYE
jgi:recombinational DNA repair ATPase RecF